MNILRLVIQEISRRKINFLLGLLSITLASAVISHSMASLARHDLRTSEIIRLKEEETAARMASLEDDYRIIMKKMGFNLLIIPENQNLADLYAEDFASSFMPESYVDTLAASGQVSIRHLLPTIQKKVEWPEYRRTVILTGTRGEVPLLHLDPKEPMQDPVAPGEIILGYELHRSLDLSTGDEVTFMGRNFTVSECYDERGSRDDITVWINLATAQEMVKKPGEINAILALKCMCAPDQLADLRGEIGSILPGTTLIEKGSRIITRAEARKRARAEAVAAIEAEKEARIQLRSEMETFNAILIPAVLAACGLLIAFLFWNNVRERRSEIGILRAIGVGTGKITSLFLVRALLIGLTGGIAGLLIGNLGFPGGLLSGGWIPAFQVAGTSLLLALAGAWIPTYAGISTDPAIVLMED